MEDSWLTPGEAAVKLSGHTMIHFNWICMKYT